MPTFISYETLVNFAWWFGIIFPGLIIAGFLFFYNRLLEKRNKEVQDNKKNLINLKEKTKSNGVGDHYKKKGYE